MDWAAYQSRGSSGLAAGGVPVGALGESGGSMIGEILYKKVEL